jgi:hypothetical protein
MKVVAPAGVTLKGVGVTALGQEPDLPGATIYGVDGAKYSIAVEGTGSLGSDAGDGGEDNGSPKVSENMPKLYGLSVATGDLLGPVYAVKWILISVLGMLAIGFAILYRKGNPPPMLDKSHERDRG